MYTYLSNISTPEIFEADSTPEIFEINPTYASPRVGTFINPGGYVPPPLGLRALPRYWVCLLAEHIAKSDRINIIRAPLTPPP